MPVEDAPELADAAHQAAEAGEVVYLTERGQPLAAIVPAEEYMRLRRLQDEEDVRKVLEGIADDGPRRVFESTEEMMRAAGLA